MLVLALSASAADRRLRCDRPVKVWETDALPLGDTTAISPHALATRYRFDFDWKFHAGDVVEEEKTRIDDENWRPVDLRHDWSIEPDGAEAMIPLPAGQNSSGKPLPQLKDFASLAAQFSSCKRNQQLYLYERTQNPPDHARRSRTQSGHPGAIDFAGDDTQ
jgi:hypothetical protein